ncbi:junctional adhesion molecule A isoform X2 [Eptesicus fuscus]|uniref:junctional adhesion molecule A isoform X2 n=1 Tax=Eptesicus fuscus TaxID=29078 RepID=UPI002403A4DC|nr:junctional adhesion molecule A isoform X2 [Eptesicus fuscus]
MEGTAALRPTALRAVRLEGRCPAARRLLRPRPQAPLQRPRAEPPPPPRGRAAGRQRHLLPGGHRCGRRRQDPPLPRVRVGPGGAARAAAAGAGGGRGRRALPGDAELLGARRRGDLRLGPRGRADPGAPEPLPPGGADRRRRPAHVHLQRQQPGQLGQPEPPARPGLRERRPQQIRPGVRAACANPPAALSLGATAGPGTKQPPAPGRERAKAGTLGGCGSGKAGRRLRGPGGPGTALRPAPLARAALGRGTGRLGRPAGGAEGGTEVARTEQTCSLKLGLLPLSLIIVVPILTLLGTLTCVCAWRRGRKPAEPRPEASLTVYEDVHSPPLRSGQERRQEQDFPGNGSTVYSMVLPQSSASTSQETAATLYSVVLPAEKSGAKKRGHSPSVYEEVGKIQPRAQHPA